VAFLFPKPTSIKERIMLKTQQKVPASITNAIINKLESLATFDSLQARAETEEKRTAASDNFAKTAHQLARITGELTVTLSTRSRPVLRELRGYIAETAQTPEQKIALASNSTYWRIKAAQLLLPRVDAAMQMAAA
jgi:hypothetical protein